MMRTTDFRGRFIALALLVFAICAFLLYQTPLDHLPRTPQLGQQPGYTGGAVLTGHAIAPRLGNATAKYVCISQFAQPSLPWLGVLELD
jgi:FAD-linked sulfhydryl oxidase